jgi:hypothetical protein
MDPEFETEDANLSSVESLLKDAEIEYSKAADAVEHFTRSSFQTLIRFFLLTNATGARIKARCDQLNLPESLRNKLLLIHFVEEYIKEQKKEKSEQ